MLVDKATNYEGQVVSIKFVTDNNQMLEAVGVYINETPDKIRLKNLQAIVPQMNKTTGQMDVGFMNFMLSGEPTGVTEIYKHTVASIALAKPEVKTELDKIASPITVEQKKIII